MAAFNVWKAGGALLSSLGEEISSMSHGGASGYESGDEVNDVKDPTFITHGRRGIFVYFVIALERTGSMSKTVHLDIESRSVNVYDSKQSRCYKCSTIFNISLDRVIVMFKTKSSRSLHPKNFKFANAHVARAFVDTLLSLIEYGNILRSAYNFMTPARQSLTIENLHYGMTSRDIQVPASSLQSILDLKDGECFDYVDFFNQLRGVHVEGLRDCLYALMVKTDICDAAPLKPSLLIGERIVKTIPNILWCIAATDDHMAGCAWGGVLAITTYRLCFSRMRYPAQRFSKDYTPPFFDLVSVPLNMIRKVKVNPAASSVVQRNVLAIKTKDQRYFRVSFMQKNLCSHEQLMELKNLIESQCFSISTKELFCFTYTPNYEPGTAWLLSDIEFDYDRQGILTDPEWRIILNTRGTMVPSYPSCFAVPKSFPPDDIFGCWNFRSKGRLPVLTYRHRARQTCLARSSQPMMGQSQTYQQLDVNLLNAYRKSGVLNEIREVEACRTAMFYIVDARGMLAAVANMAAGRGTEDVTVYERTELIYGGIDNIHVMRSSMEQLCSAVFCNRGRSVTSAALDEGFHRKVDASNWLVHCSRVLSASITVAEKLHLEGCSVLVHCSDGWDRTAQLTATAQLLLDPYYRTLQGFAVLVEKEWCAFGHKFDDRCGNAAPSSSDPEERSPIFLQWLDVVHNIRRQFTSAFEFNEYMLVFVADHVYSGLFGNFIGNCESERVHELQVREKTVSIWDYIFHRSEKFIDTSYREVSRPLWPSCGLRSMALWDRYFLRWDPACHPRCESPDDDWRDDWGCGFETAFPDVAS